MVKEKRRGIILNFFTLWAVFVLLCDLAIKHRVFKPMVAVKPLEEWLLILSLPTLAVAVIIAIWMVLRSIDYSLQARWITETTKEISESKTKPMSDWKIFLDDHVIEYFWGMFYGLWDLLTGKYKTKVHKFLSGDDRSAKFCKEYHISERRHRKIFRETLEIISNNLNRGR